MIFGRTVVKSEPLALSSVGLSADERSRRNRIEGRGYGGCLRCGDRWNWKKEHHTQVTDGTGMFPLCQECWLTLGTAEKRYPFYEALITQWQADGMPREEADEQRELALKALQAERC
jgi:hypothetical protein